LRDQGGQARNLADFSGKEHFFSLALPVKLKYFVVKFGGKNEVNLWTFTFQV
jgi:hypothetical protein